MRTLFLLGFLSAALSAPTYALDQACEAILSASEARLKQASWHSVTIINKSLRLEVIKANGQFYNNIDAKWSKSPINLDDTERALNAQVRSGEVKITQCKLVGSETINGVAVNVISSRTEMAGLPAADSSLYIGKADGLPYRQVGANLVVEYSYKDVTAPKL